MTSTDTASGKKHLYLIDGSGFIFRAYHALPPMTRADNTPVNAVYGYTTMLLKVIEEHSPSHLVVIFDAARKNFRNDLYPDYKAHRPPPPDDLIPQFALVREATEALGIPQIQMEGFEADDLIATYVRVANEQGEKVTIVSSDKDLMQLVSDDVTMFDAMKNKSIGPKEVAEKFGVPPEKVIDILALAGDASDNIPGAPGIGPKTATTLINEYGSLESLLERAGEIKQPKRRQTLIDFADQIRISKQLVSLDAHVPIDINFDRILSRQPQADVLIPFLKEQNFKSLLTKFSNHFAANGDTDEPSTNAPIHTEIITSYTCLNSLSALQNFMDEMVKKGSFSFSLETDPTHTQQKSIRGIALSHALGQAIYIPFASISDENSLFDQPQTGLTAAEVLSTLKPLLQNKEVLKLVSDEKSIRHALAPFSISLKPVEDISTLSYVVENGLHGHDLKTLASVKLSEDLIKEPTNSVSAKVQTQFLDSAPEEQTKAAGQIADFIFRLYGFFKPEISQHQQTFLYENLERRLLPVLFSMEHAGIKICPQALKKMSDGFGKRLQDLEADIHEAAGKEFNIASPKQLGEVLFEDLKLPINSKKTKSGSYSTGQEVLEQLVVEGHHLPEKILEWRQISKLKSTYTDALPTSINPQTGRIHTTFATTVASTGRLSSVNPNLQNIPVRTPEGRHIRSAFIADKGNVLLSADYSQIELRLLAHIAQIDPLKVAFSEGTDIHSLTASQMFGIPLSEVDSDTRRKAKAINFGIIYGISAFGLAKQVGCARHEARDYMQTYFEKYPGIKRYMDATIAFARKNGFVETLYNRRIHLPQINNKNPSLKAFSERAAINAPLQGSQADIIKKAMVQLASILPQKHPKARMLLQVHDELLFEVSESAASALAKTVQSVMENTIHLSLPLTVDVKAGLNWETMTPLISE